MVFGNVPDPGIDTRIMNKPELAGWNDRGPRNIVGVCVHRMLGTLEGTEGHFMTQFDQAGNPNFGWFALTDFGIGGQMDPGLNGAIWQWNPLNGNRSPWANGWDKNEDPWVVTEGHGREFLQKWIPQGYDLNRDLASIELSGCSTDATRPQSPPPNSSRSATSSPTSATVSAKSRMRTSRSTRGLAPTSTPSTSTTSSPERTVPSRQSRPCMERTLNGRGRS
jgi:hypothetical protein